MFVVKYPSLFAQRRLFAGRPARPGLARRARRYRHILQLETLESRLVPTCMPGPGDNWYVWDYGQPGDGTGSETDPWRNVAILNTQIEADTICPGDTIYLRRGSKYTDTLVFNGHGGTAAAPITVDGLSWGDPQILNRALLEPSTGSGISIRNAGGFNITGLAIAGSYDPDDAHSPSNGNGIEVLLGPA